MAGFAPPPAPVIPNQQTLRDQLRRLIHLGAEPSLKNVVAAIALMELHTSGAFGLTREQGDKLFDSLHSLRKTLEVAGHADMLLWRAATSAGLDRVAVAS